MMRTDMSVMIVRMKVRQLRIGQPWLGPTRACVDFTDFKKTAISQKLKLIFSRDSDLTTSVVRLSVCTYVRHQNPLIINKS